MAYPLKYIKNIYINNQQIVKTDNDKTLIFRDFPFIEKISFIDNLPPDIYSGKKDAVLQKTISEFSPNRISDLFPEVKCPYCKNKMEGVLTNDSFFII